MKCTVLKKVNNYIKSLHGGQNNNDDHFETRKNIESLCCEQELTQCDKSIILKATF